MRQRDEELSRELESLRRKIEELEELSKGRGLGSVFNFKHATSEAGKLAKTA